MRALYYELLSAHVKPKMRGKLDPQYHYPGASTCRRTFDDHFGIC